MKIIYWYRYGFGNGDVLNIKLILILIININEIYGNGEKFELWIVFLYYYISL